MADPKIANYLLDFEKNFMQEAESDMLTSDFADLFNQESNLDNPDYESLWQKENIKIWMKSSGSRFDTNIPLICQELVFDPKYSIDHVI